MRKKAEEEIKVIGENPSDLPSSSPPSNDAYVYVTQVIYATS